jgi:hypothetical protein
MTASEDPLSSITLGEKKANVKYRFRYATPRFVLFPFSSLCCHLEAMTNRYHRSAGVTAAATFALLASTCALLAWGYLLLPLLNAPPDAAGRHAYQTYPIEFAAFTFLPPLLIAFTVRTAIGILQLRPWARLAALLWAAAALALCLTIIAFRPFQTFFIPGRFVSQAESFKQLVTISFVIVFLPASLWWLFFFRLSSVKRQFQQVRGAPSLRNPDVSR